MPTFSDQDIKDLVTGTLNEYGPPEFQQIAQTLPDYEVMGKWLKEDKVMIDSGIGIARTVMLKTAGAAKHVGLFEVDDTDVVDLLSQLSIPWRHAQTYWAFERREALMNKGKSLIVKVIEPRREGALLDMAQTLEDAAWSKPVDSNDKKLPFGVPYWVVKNATQGFNGGNPSGFTSGAGGISTTTNPTWANWTDTYTNVTKADAIKNLRKAFRQCKFKSPVPGSKAKKIGDKYRLYVNETTLSNFEDVGEAQNENLGRDVASMDDTITFKKTPIVWIPKLDADTQNPIYFINHDTFSPVVLDGDFLRESEPEKVAKQHNLFNVFTDLTYNFLCINRRANGVLYKV